jgi:methylated-DNA-protein-cysteine methyltransferase related protein
VSPKIVKRQLEFERAVAARLKDLLPGDVSTYGEIAIEAGFPGRSRSVGRFLKNSEGYPWWRVVNHKGRLVPGMELLQSRLLKSEGVQTRNGYVTGF